MSFDLDWLLLPLVACAILTSLHTYLGIHVIRRKVLFVDLALAQVSALGSTIALLRGYEPGTHESYMMGLAFAGMGAVVLALTRSRREALPQEAVIGLVFAIASAVAILLASLSPHGAEDLQRLMAGSLVTVQAPQVRNAAILYVVLGAFHLALRHRFVTISCRPAEAEAQGWSLAWWDFLFYASFAFVITMSVQIAGVLLVFCLLVAPAAFAVMWSEEFRTQLIIGWSVSLAACAIGLPLSYDLMPGPVIICVFAALLLGSAIVRGLLAKNQRMTVLARTGAGAVAVLASIALVDFLAPKQSAGRPEPGQMGEPASPGATAGGGPDSGGHEHGSREHAVGETPADLRMALRDEHENVRAKAAEDLAATGDRSSIPDLLPLLHDPSAAVKEAAARAIAALGAEEAVDPLVKGLARSHDDEWVPLEFAKALCALGRVEGLDALARLAVEGEARLVRDVARKTLFTLSDLPTPPTPAPGPIEAMARWTAWRARCPAAGPTWDPTRKKFISETPESDPHR